MGEDRVNPRDPMTNAELKDRYNDIYRKGEDTYFSKFVEGVNVSEADALVLGVVEWAGKRVLDIGCGTGAMVRAIKAAGAREVVGIDYAQTAIDAATMQGIPDGVTFRTAEVTDLPREPFDVIVSLGTMEHMDDPEIFLGNAATLLGDGGVVLITCPHFINLRGFVWMAFALTLDVPMSLTDLHFIHPWQMDEWAKAAELQVLEMQSCDQDRGNGRDLPRDFDKRLRNALRDAALPNDRVDRYIAHLDDLTRHLAERGEDYRLDGATALYRLSR
jgi:2-polyprenyl-3-methyl-5-hydroxy-6-metoxy-1,4-benzoquinol methylase